MDKIPDEVIQFIEKTMETCRVELTAGGKSLAEVKIQKGIFQKDALSPLLFVIAMMPLNHILRKCAVDRKKRSTTLCTWTTLNYLTRNERKLET